MNIIKKTINFKVENKKIFPNKNKNKIYIK